MKSHLYLLGGLVGTTLAYPGMGNLLRELVKRQSDDTPVRMIGDLVERATSDVGSLIQDCLSGGASCQLTSPKSYVAPDLNSAACAADTCCVWDYIQSDLVGLFSNSDGTCNDLARAAVRLGFHDAGAWSTSSGGGGADGSLVLSPDEITRSENNGLQDIRSQALSILSKYSSFKVGAADLVQFMHNVATITCPLGPRVLTFVGRPDQSTADPPGLLPDVNSPADVLIQLFEDKTFSPTDLVALIGAHTAAKQFFVDTALAGEPLDSTPGVWDVEFYSETLAASPPAGVFRLPSDGALAAFAETTPDFTLFGNQGTWNAAYATAYVRMSLLGVQSINTLTDCTKTLPNPVTSFARK